MGGLGFGLSRDAATEFSFFLAIPALLGASFIKLAGDWSLLSFSDLPMLLPGFCGFFCGCLGGNPDVAFAGFPKVVHPICLVQHPFGTLLFIIYSGDLAGF